MTVYDCSLVELPKISSRSGNITPIEGQRTIPFDIKRVFYTYDIPGGESRGAHAHKKCHQLLVAASGAYEVYLDDGINKRTVLLNRPFYGLHIPPGIWAAEQGFSSGSICLVLASLPFDESDYIRDYDDFLNWRREEFMPIRSLTSSFEMSRYGLHVRLVNESDAEFILSLRRDEKLSRFIHYTDDDIEKQRLWIREYKKREEQGTEYYFIYDIGGEYLGVNRIYSIKNRVCTGGSWICRPQAEYRFAIATSLFIRDIMFEVIGFEKEVFEVRKANVGVVKTQKLMGAEITGENEIDFSFQLDKEKYLLNRKKIIRLLNL